MIVSNVSDGRHEYSKMTEKLKKEIEVLIDNDWILKTIASYKNVTPRVVMNIARQKYKVTVKDSKWRKSDIYSWIRR